MTQLKSKSSYILDERKLGLKRREDTISWIKENGKKLDEAKIESSTVTGAFIDHREFWLVVFVVGKAGYKRLNKHLREAKEADKKAHTKTKLMKGQLFILADPDRWLDYFIETKIY